MNNVEPEFNIEEFCNMLDIALASNNEGVQAALRNLVMLTSLSQPTEHVRGPFERLFQSVNNLHDRVDQLEQVARRESVFSSNYDADRAYIKSYEEKIKSLGLSITNLGTTYIDRLGSDSWKNI